MKEAAEEIKLRFMLVKISRSDRTTCVTQIVKFFFVPWHSRPPADQGLLIIEDKRSHSDTPHLVGLLWMSDQPIAETSA
jgi:hypothetical protein